MKKQIKKVNRRVSREERNNCLTVPHAGRQAVGLHTRFNKASPGSINQNLSAASIGITLLEGAKRKRLSPRILYARAQKKKEKKKHERGRKEKKHRVEEEHARNVTNPR